MFAYRSRINGARQGRVGRKREDALEFTLVPHFDAVRQLAAFIRAGGGALCLSEAALLFQQGSSQPPL